MSTPWEEFLKKHNPKQEEMNMEKEEELIEQTSPYRCTSCGVENIGRGVCRGCGAQLSYQV